MGEVDCGVTLFVELTLVGTLLTVHLVLPVLLCVCARWPMPFMYGL